MLAHHSRQPTLVLSTLGRGWRTLLDRFTVTCIDKFTVDRSIRVHCTASGKCGAAQLLCSMNPAEIPSFLREHASHFQDFSDQRLAELAAGGRVVSVEAGVAIAHIGDDAGFLGVVLEGELIATAPGEGGRTAELLRFKAGETFGELGLMTGDKVTADIVAATRAQVLEIPVELFRTAVLSEPAAAERISKAVATRLREVIADPARSAAALDRSADPHGLRLHSERPQKLLVFNCGSSSVKYSFFDTASDTSQARGMIERIGTSGTRHIHHGPNGETTRELPGGGYADAFDALLAALTDPRAGVIRTPGEVSAVGHRVVHGGGRFTEATLITDGAMAHLEELSPLAPLHNPVNLAGIREARRVFPHAPQVAVFDTGFHHTLPSYAYLYQLPAICPRLRRHVLRLAREDRGSCAPGRLRQPRCDQRTAVVREHLARPKECPHLYPG